MRTRVIARFNAKTGRDEFTVQRWGHYDRAKFSEDFWESAVVEPDPAIKWRPVVTVPTAEEAMEIASRVATQGKFEERVVAEFGYD